MEDPRQESPTQGLVGRCPGTVWGVSGAQESQPWLGTVWNLAEIRPGPGTVPAPSRCLTQVP